MFSPSKEKFNIKLNLLSFIVLLLVCVLSVNLAIVPDLTLFAVFFTVAASASAWLATAKSPILSLTAAFAGWAIAFTITQNSVYSLLSISYLPLSLSLDGVSRKKLSRSAAIAAASGVITIGTVITLIYLTYARIGTVSLSAIRSAFPFFFNQISEVLYESFFVSVAESKVSLIAESNVVGYINVIICLIPAVFCALMTVVGFVIAFIHRKLCEITAVSSFDGSLLSITPSIVTAIFFTAALIAVMIFEEVNLISLTAVSMALILLPFVLLSGLFTSFSPKETNGILRPRLFRPLTVIISLFNGLAPFLSLCIFYGLFDSFRASLSQRKKKNQE